MKYTLRMNNNGSEIVIVIPCFNESSRIVNLVDTIHILSLDLSSGANSLKFLIVNNGCTDDSFDIFERLRPSHALCCNLDVSVIQENQGLGYGIKIGLLQTQNRSVCIIPADGKYAPSEISALIRQYRAFNDSSLLVKGLRIGRNDPFTIRCLSAIYSNLVNILFGTRVKDVNGLPKIFFNDFSNNEIDLLSNNACFDGSLLALWHKKGLRVQEIPLNFQQNLDDSPSWSGKRLLTSLRMLKETVQTLKRFNNSL